MKIVIVNFSGKLKNGNGEKISLYIKKLLCKNEVQIINFKQLNINSCNMCNYECFEKMSSCRYIDDDIKFVYDSLINADYNIYIIPIYSDYPCSNYFAFRERSQCYFDEVIYNKYSVIRKSFIIIGNSGFENTYNIVHNDYKDINRDSFLQLSSNKYSTKSINGDLITFDGIKLEISNFINNNFIKLE
ncbi:flavodoxin family protein [Sedimentibacter sp. zth1]|uniref:NAD(P)H-dependent oxidoreductase n=1 Tax=Sedimentibacter sp. zth1 TaxID=2816908 RepID=UPI001A92F858|nr:NAD(P)H-dependent oxidoreductase [Sedimentibacter sp. zth1]QSX06480.1 flavodoxin family protein [Sedimentibacter sp. zth1]